MNKAILRFPQFKVKAFTLSFDDGLKYDEKLISVMDKYSFKGTFNINSGLLASSPQEYGIHTRLTLDECVALYQRSDNEVAVHGKHHVPLVGVERGVAINEVISDRCDIEKAFNKVVKGMAYPYGGSFDNETKQIVKDCGIEYSRTCDDTYSFELPTDWITLNPTCHQKDERLLKLAKEFSDFSIEEGGYDWFRKTPKWFLLWGHSTEYAIDDSWHLLEKLGEMLGNRQDVWYATTGEIYNYVRSFESLKFSVDNRFVENSSAIDVYLTINGQNYIATAGKTVKIGELSKGKELL